MQTAVPAPTPAGTRIRMPGAPSGATSGPAGEGGGGVDASLAAALQDSEQLRLLLLFFILTLMAISAFLKHTASGVPGPGLDIGATLFLLSCGATYTLALGATTGWAQRHHVLLPVWMWLVAALFEATLPTVALLLLQQRSGSADPTALAAPAILLYGVFTVTSVLHLRPWLTLIGGAWSAAGHLLLVGMTFSSVGRNAPAGEVGYYLAYAPLIFLTGVAGAVVSRDLCRHLRESLRAADDRRALEVVKKELDIARSIQQGLLPKAAPRLPDYDIAGWNRPASHTGGDYYDWQALPDGRLAVVIADVTGHGLGATLLMATCRSYARGCMADGAALGASLRRINALLHDDMSLGRFVTFATGVLDPESGDVELLSAGHGPILHVSGDGAVLREYGGSGLPLGVSADEDYGAPSHVHLDPGDALLFITDGFIEWPRAGGTELFGVARLRDFLTRNPHLDAVTLINKLEAVVEAFGHGVPQPDDMTAVVIRRLR